MNCCRRLYETPASLPHRLSRALGGGAGVGRGRTRGGLGNEFDLVWFPQEVTYPFPTILFCRPKATTGHQLPADLKGYTMTAS